ncbi:MAG: hypothetical protein ACLUN9_19675 [Enterocloster aldenensis]|nr:hypothetical protein [uncultured Lachnoclostridium sp.]MDM8297201.1 hypothetical protein [Enterocloster aldenensis]MDY4530889.1 hypothetical protein [Enterocloster aldenensis]
MNTQSKEPWMPIIGRPEPDAFLSAAPPVLWFKGRLKMDMGQEKE